MCYIVSNEVVSSKHLEAVDICFMVLSDHSSKTGVPHYKIQSSLLANLKFQYVAL